MKPIRSFLRRAMLVALLLAVGQLASESTTLVSGSDPSGNEMSASQKLCGIATLASSEKIYGGDYAKFGAWPWVSHLRTQDKDGIEYRCGGSLISPEWVLTAAHCVHELTVLNVRLGEYNLSTTEEPLPHVDRLAKLSIVHENYIRSPCDDGTCPALNDIALLKLDQPVDLQAHIFPVCLPEGDEDDLSGAIATVVGWGRTEKKTPSDTLKELQVPIVSNKLCRKWYQEAGFNRPVPETQLCAGYAAPGYNGCHGDSGGPLQIRNCDNSYTQVGIVSGGGEECGEPKELGVYTRISKYLNWISTTMSSAS